MQISSVIQALETLAPLHYQEGYDNAGLITGNPEWECKGIIICLDVTEAVVEEAIRKNCNLIVSHHPVLFQSIKKLQPFHYVEKMIIKAIQHNLALYAIHTNLDNVLHGVNGVIAEKLQLTETTVLSPLPNQLKKLYTYVPIEHAEAVRAALFEAKGGTIGNYTECSFNINGTGTFKPGEHTQPFTGKKQQRNEVPETKIEIIFPAHIEAQLLQALLHAHPYEEPAYDIVSLNNTSTLIGSGLIGKLNTPVSETDFLQQIKNVFHLSVIRHSALLHKPIHTVALCGGAGSFLISKAKRRQADIFITADIKYHDFFEADNAILLADIGHWESEQYTIDLLCDYLRTNFSNFAVFKTGIYTNAVHYF